MPQEPTIARGPRGGGLLAFFMPRLGLFAGGRGEFVKARGVSRRKSLWAEEGGVGRISKGMPNIAHGSKGAVQRVAAIRRLCPHPVWIHVSNGEAV